MLPSGISYVDSVTSGSLVWHITSVMPQIPDVPTLNELGIPFEHCTNRGIFLPRAPSGDRDKLAKVFETVIAESDSDQQDRRTGHFGELQRSGRVQNRSWMTPWSFMVSSAS